MSIVDQATGLYLCDQCDKVLSWEEAYVCGEMIHPPLFCHECFLSHCRNVTKPMHDNTINVSVQNPVIKFKKLHPDAVIPTRATDGSAGFDLYIHSLEYESDYDTVKIGCGVAAGIPAGYVGLLSVRSSTYKYGLELVNQIGVVDSDFTNEVFIRLKSNELAPDAAFPETGTRIAQMVVIPFLGESIEVDELPSTTRTGGCGSTGK